MRRKLYQPRNGWTLVSKPAPGCGRVIGQVRFSSELQDGGYSIEVQKRQILLTVAQEGWELVGWCEELATSAKGELDTRPKLAELLMVQAGVVCNVIVCHESSRWTRNQALGDKSLEILRQKHCWWQTADGQWDINKVLQEGFDVAWAITQVANAAFLRKLSSHVKKGKLGKAQEGYSNGFSMFGYRMPEMVIPSETSRISQVRRRVVFEPHPDLFPVLQQVGELLAWQPPLTLPQVADELNRLGLTFWSRRYGRRVWSDSVLNTLLYRQYHREYASGSGHGTITLANGELVEGRHVPAWSYELCQKIDENRSLLGMNRHARPRKGAIRAFSGMIRCIHCGRLLITRTQQYPAQGRTYVYYACTTPKTYGISCRAGSDRRHCAIRTEVVDQQFGTILGWLGGWSAEALAHMRQLYELDVGGASDPQQEDERKRAELVRRRANLSRQHELGVIDDAQLVSRMGEIRQEEARIPPPGSQRRVRWDQTLEAIKALESLGAQWREASIAGEDGLCHRMAFALVDTIYFDLCQQRVVGVGPKGDIALPVKKRLEEHGWYEREPGVLWKDHPDELSIGGIRTRYDEVADALRDGVLTVQEMADRLGMGYKQVHAYLRRMIREGDAISEQVPDAGTKHLRFKYVGSVRQAPDEPRLLPLPVWQEE